jgi:Cu/Ag efflux pump CusA
VPLLFAPAPARNPRLPAIVVIGGLVSATLLTLVVLPLCTANSSWKERA